MDSLPDHLLQECLWRLRTPDQAVVRCVCRRFRDLSSVSFSYEFRAREGSLEPWLYVIGGIQGRKGELLAEMFDFGAYRWRRMPTFPPNPSFNFSCAVVGDSLYAIGGFAGLSENAMKMPVYNLRTNMWMEANQIKGLREAFACGVIGGRIYVAGGFCRQKSKEKMLRSAEMYIPERDIWCPVASMCQGRSCCASAVVGDKLFVIGGYGAQTVLRTVEVYDPAENSWEQKTSMPRMWILAGCASVGTKIYVVGSDIRAMDRQELAVFDTQLDSWNEIGLIPFNELVSGSKCSLWGCGVASVGEQLYIAGGASSYDGGGLNTVLVYDPGTEQWGTMRQMCSRRHCCAVVTIYH